jgi:hypothetical protein
MLDTGIKIGYWRMLKIQSFQKKASVLYDESIHNLLDSLHPVGTTPSHLP